MGKPALDQQKQLDVSFKTAQYFASLTSQQDVWSEVGKVMNNFYNVDLFGFAKRQSDGKIISNHWILPDKVSCERILTAKTKEIINEVMESGFLATYHIDIPAPYSLVFLSVKQKDQTPAVILVGHKMSEPLPKEIINVYLAVAGLIGITVTKLTSEEELKSANQQLRASEQQLRASNQQLRANEQRLIERLKELKGLYGLSKLISQFGVSLEDLFQGCVNLIPSAWQYPDITCARITFEGKEFKTDNFKKTKWLQSSDIETDGKKAGTVEVYYLKESPEAYEGPFLKEERNLLNGIANQLSLFAEHKEAEEQAEKHLLDLEVFYKASVGREERVVGLKKEISRLKEELGRK